MKEAVGIAFYSKETYKRLLERADDREALHDKYKDWLKSYNTLFNFLKQSGVRVEAFEINLEQLRLWCLQNNLPNTQSSRSKFVSDMLNNRP